MKKKVLITGGAGFIGSNLKKALSKSEFEILTVGRSKKENFQIDLKDPQLHKIIQSFLPDIVCHFASGSNIKNAEKNQEKELKDTVTSSECLLQSLSFPNLKNTKIIYLSSQAVYGLPKYLPVDELHPTNPTTIYAKNKLMVEDLIIQSKLNYLIFRVSSAYGEGQNYEKSGVVASFIDKMRKNQSPIIFNSQDLFFDFIYIKDIVSAIAKSITDDSIKNEIFNLGSGIPISLKKLLDILYKQFPAAPLPEVQKNTLYLNEGQKGFYFNIKKIQAQLKWATKYNIEAGLREIWEAIELQSAKLTKKT